MTQRLVVFIKRYAQAVFKVFDRLVKELLFITFHKLNVVLQQKFPWVCF